MESRDATSRLAGAILSCLETGNEAVRCAALRVPGVHEAHRQTVIDLLLDPDPDVRSDAMDVLATLARPGDSGVIMRSLRGDPVREVKLAAIRALVRTGDRACLPLLRRLIHDRCEDEINWEDEQSDDWLDVQPAAIRAAAALGAPGLARDLLAVRADEFGQNLDGVIAGLLARIPGEGLPALLEMYRDADGRTRAIAAGALVRHFPDEAARLAGQLARDGEPRVRALVLSLPEMDDGLVRLLALGDPEPAIRAEALERHGPGRPKLLREALGDRDETVVARALDTLCGMDASLAGWPDLEDNLHLWIRKGGPALAAASARCLRFLCPQTASPHLSGLACDQERPVEARLAALDALGRLPAGIRPDEAALRQLLHDPLRQIRLAALTLVRDLARAGDGTCSRLLEEILTDAPGLVPEEEFRPGSAALPAPSSSPVRIMPDGTIAPLPPGEAPKGMSTLDAIQRDSQEQRAPGEDVPCRIPEAGGGKRVPVGGPAEFREDLRRTAIAMTTFFPDGRFLACLAPLLRSDSPLIRRAAFEAVGKGHGELSAGITAALEAGLSDPDPVIRYCALRRLPEEKVPESFLSDPDPPVRCLAWRALLPDRIQDHGFVMTGLADASGMVRQAVADICTGQGEMAGAALTGGLSLCLRKGYVDTLAHAAATSPVAVEWIAGRIRQKDTPPGEVLLLLQAIGQSWSAPGPVSARAEEKER